MTKLVRGELDWIVMKSLEKDRNRRYESTNGFAADVLRYLADEPVQACPPSLGYRVGKFVRRYKGPVLAASLILLLLVGGIIGTTFGFLKAQESEEQAQEEVLKAGQERDAANQARVDEKEQRRLAVAAAEEAKEQRKLAEAATDREKKKRKLAEDRGDELRQNLYVAEMSLALARSISWNADGTRPALTSDEDTTIWEADVGKATHTLATGVTPVRWCPHGKRLASFGPGRTIKIWDGFTGAQLLTLKGHTGPITSIAWSPDGTRLVSSSVTPDISVRMWDTVTGNEVISFRMGTTSHVAWSPDGLRVAVGVGGTPGLGTIVMDATRGYQPVR